MKKCKNCSIEVVVGETIVPSRMKNGYYICSPCHKIQGKKYYKANKTKKWKIDGQWKKGNYTKESHTKAVHNYHNKYKGVYGIFENGVCLYVGESSKVMKRFSDHKVYIKNPENKTLNGFMKDLYYKLQTHNHLIFGILEETENHKERESYYINKLKPIYNGKN